MKSILLPILIFVIQISSAQIDTSKSTLTFSGYAETYYSYDFNQPSDHNRPSFFYSHNRHNEFNLNLGFIKAAYNTVRTRANLALAAGSYMNANYSAEPGVLKNIFEANGGFKLLKNKNLWLDAGIFASHIGFEGAVSKDCWSLTRSILADNSPYYESGAKISYTSNNNKWFLSGMILNGWQHIQRPDGNNSPAFGTQITYSPNSSVTLNYSTFVGNDKPDETKRMRYFHNLYGIFHLTEKLHATAGFDYGIEQKEKDSNDFYNWYSPVILIKLNLDNNWSLTARAEYYTDKNGVIIPTGTQNGFQATGYSLNLDYKIRENAFWRAEIRNIQSKDKIFNKENDAVNNNTFVTTSISISF